MKKSKKNQVTRFNIKAWLKRSGYSFWKNARPFLAPKYWPVYLIAFCAGIYLWGSSHGWQNFYNWQNHQSQKKVKTPTTETIQNQLKLLKQELQTTQKTNKIAAFDPANFSRPALGQVIRGFEWVEAGNSWRLHTGVDIGVTAESNIIASAAGTVSGVKEMGPGDYTVTVSHGDGWRSIYANLAKVMVFEGQPIIKGVIIGSSSNKGCDQLTPCFHFAIYHDQKAIDPQKIIQGM